MKTQHSPAPWQWSQHGPTRCLRDAKDATVLTIDNGTLPMPEDARLIAAVPDLLEACVKLLARCETRPDVAKWLGLHDMKIAVAEALGQPTDGIVTDL